MFAKVSVHSPVALNGLGSCVGTCCRFAFAILCEMTDALSSLPRDATTLVCHGSCTREKSGDWPDESGAVFTRLWIGVVGRESVGNSSHASSERNGRLLQTQVLDSLFGN